MTRIQWKRGRRASELAIGYPSRCGRYRVDCVNWGGTIRWRAMVRAGDRWEFLTQTRFRERRNAEAACQAHADLPQVCQVEFAG